jgi:hypothetical protein
VFPPFVIQSSPGTAARSAAVKAGAAASDGNPAVPTVVCEAPDERNGIADTDAASKRAAAEPRRSTRFSLMVPPEIATPKTIARAYTPDP